MVLWRISRHRDLKGIGRLKSAGHYAGHVIVYLTETPASALLEAWCTPAPMTRRMNSRY
jgi:hypothetical protein